jgi:hypothetical protein
MHVTVKSSRAGFLYLLYGQVDKSLKCLFPNRIQTDNRIPAAAEIVIPDPNAEFRLRIGPPYGKELLKAVVMTVALEPKDFGVESLTVADFTPLEPVHVKGAFVELKEQPMQWAEHEVEIITLPLGKSLELRRPRRVGLFVGVSQYADPEIPALAVSYNDAHTMKAVMQKHCGLDEAILLTGEHATREAIRSAICQTLAEATWPGDLVFIYWSGRGATCPDDNGDEDDRHDEFLVPYDGRLADLETTRQSMLLDDTFDRWIQDLDGRRLVLIMETSPVVTGGLEFLDGELVRAKDVGRSEIAMLYSAEPDQIALERREEDLSVMTYFLVELLRQADGPVSLAEAFDHLKVEVPRYVTREFPGITQTPGLISHLGKELHLRP